MMHKTCSINYGHLDDLQKTLLTTDLNKNKLSFDEIFPHDYCFFLSFQSVRVSFESGEFPYLPDGTRRLPEKNAVLTVKWCGIDLRAISLEKLKIPIIRISCGIAHLKYITTKSLSESWLNGRLWTVLYFQSSDSCINLQHATCPLKQYLPQGLKRTGMMTSSNGNIFRVTGHLWGEFTGPRWIPRTKASGAVLWCFLWSASE